MPPSKIPTVSPTSIICKNDNKKKFAFQKKKKKKDCKWFRKKKSNLLLDCARKRHHFVKKLVGFVIKVEFHFQVLRERQSKVAEG